MQHQALLALGSNLGNRSENLHRALALLEQDSSISILKVSRLYETAPIGMHPDDPAELFVNAVVWIKTSLSPNQLLTFCLNIERMQGRERDFSKEKQGYASRTIDLDILLFDDLVLQASELDIPHPRLQERAFVLVPLAEVVPEWEHPVLKKTISQLLLNLETSGQVRLLPEPVRT